MARLQIPITELFNLESPLATEYRRLFQNLKRKGTEIELKSILVTSAVTGEGKSTISSLLAITAARKGFKTLVIDCDLRRPAVHRLFRLERQGGLVEVLADGQAFKSVIKKTSLENLDVVTAGKVYAHPSELFNTQAVDTLIHELKFYYDFAIIDSPPVIPVSDPMLLSQSSDGVLLIVKAGSTAREVVKRAADILTTNQANILGVVLNNSSNSLPYYYDYTHYHYDYRPSGDPGSKSSRRTQDGEGKGQKGRREKTDGDAGSNKGRLTR
jgi:capsular exopolysaccharide synthesis family protein